MQTWTVGDVEIVRIADLDFALPADETMLEWMVPSLAPSTSEYRVAFSALAVRDGDTRVVVDPWLQAERDKPEAAATVERLLGELERAGFAADEVDLVVNTHLESVGWNTRPDGDDWVLTFPNARYVYPADEVAAVAAGEPVFGSADFIHLQDITDVEAVVGIAALTESISVEPTVGHSWGHQIVRIESLGDVAIYLGHLVIHPLQIARPGVHEWEHESAIAAGPRTQYLGELADREGLLLTTLVGGAGGGCVRRDGDGFRLA